MGVPQVSLVIPTYKEAANLEPLLARVASSLARLAHAGALEVLVVDDDSPDRTWEVAERLRARYPFLRVLRRTAGPRGLSPAVVEGWRTAQGGVLGVMDADLQHPPESLPALLQAMEDPVVDVVVASRYAGAGSVGRWSWLRRWLSQGATNLARSVLPPEAHGVTDPMSGYFLIRRRVVEGVVLQARGYKILLEVLGRGRYGRVREVPYTFGRRHTGQSKLTWQVVGDYVAQLWGLVWAPTGFGRFVRYCLVGGTGVAVNMGVLWWLKDSGALGTLRAGAVAVEAAILNNFLWNELWTFRDRAAARPQLHRRLARLAHFNLVCAAGAGWHLLLLWLLAIQGGWNYLAANAVAIVVVTGWNYGLNTAWTWTRREAPAAGGPSAGLALAPAATGRSAP
jgi:dolichol-phosphate mannosyltransferase